MQPENNHSVADEELQHDREVLDLLMDEDNRWPWTVEELGREYGNEVVVQDALARLQGGGLIHRLENLVFPSRSATYGSRLGS